MLITLWITFSVLTGHGTQVELPFQRIFISIFLITAAPVILGMYLNHRYTRFCTNIRPFIRTLATVIFAFIVMGAFLGNQDNIIKYFLDLGPYMIALNMITLAIGYVTARKLKSNKADSITISMESGLQNVAQAIFVAVSVLHNAELMIPAIIYAVIMNISVGAIIYWARRSLTDELSPAIK
jgi:bile acid:Na+ symporter, BASS family